MKPKNAVAPSVPPPLDIPMDDELRVRAKATRAAAVPQVCQLLSPLCLPMAAQDAQDRTIFQTCWLNDGPAMQRHIGNLYSN